MNRRHFIQSLAAVFSLPANPAFSLQSATAAIPTAAAVPANARFWAIYISALHGECTPKALQNMVKIPASDAQHYISQLITDGVIKPNPLLRSAVSDIIKNNDDSLFNKIKKRLDKKTEANEALGSEMEEQNDALALETLPDDEHIEGQRCLEAHQLTSDDTSPALKDPDKTS